MLLTIDAPHLSNPDFTHGHALLEREPMQTIPVTWLNNSYFFSLQTKSSQPKPTTQDPARRQIAWLVRLSDKISQHQEILGIDYLNLQQRGQNILLDIFATPYLLPNLREIGMDVLPEGTLVLTLYLPSGQLYLNSYVNLEDDPDDTVLDFYAAGNDGKANWQWEGPVAKLGAALRQVTSL